MKIKNIYRLGALMMFGTALSACTFLDTDPQIIPGEGYYTSETKLQYGLAGVYGALSSEALYGHYYSLQISNADDLCYYANYNSVETRPDRYNHTAGTSVIYDTWLQLYKGIKNANEYIKGVEASVADSKIDTEGLSVGIERYLAEAKFLRAFYHFLLAQAWGDVPLRVESATSPNPEDVQLAATPQEEVLKWCVDEIEAIVDDLNEEVDETPSRVSKTVAEGILARIYLFMAGETVAEIEGLPKQEMYKKAAEWAYEVIRSGKHQLNPSYEQVFINMIQDAYDLQYRESMWEAEFLGDRTSSNKWTNGRIGDLIGLKSQGGSNYSEWACNYSYGFYNGSYTLWQLYETDRLTEEEVGKENADLSPEDDEYNIKGQLIIDKRRLWNLPGYNYRGYSGKGPSKSQEITYKQGGVNVTRSLLQEKSMYKTPWVYQNNFAMREIEGLDLTVENAYNPGLDPNKETDEFNYDPDVMCAIRNAGKWRRETIYEKQMSAKNLYTGINFPILRYADVLLMFAEAANEYNGQLTDRDGNTITYTKGEALLAIRKRAGIKTYENEPDEGAVLPDMDQETFRKLIRNERGRELAFEALRKYDLIRWGTFVQEMQLSGTNIPRDSPGQFNQTYTDFAAVSYGNVSERHIYLPIPTKELAVNHALQQNPLW